MSHNVSHSLAYNNNLNEVLAVDTLKPRWVRQVRWFSSKGRGRKRLLVQSLESRELVFYVTLNTEKQKQTEEDATRNKKLLGVPGIATRSKDDTRSFFRLQFVQS